MIAYLQGKLTLKTPTYVYVDCHGVGYHANISLNTFSKLETLEDIKLLTYVHHNDDGQSMYGFMDEAERQMFVLLISVSGVGPNTARVILSYMSTDEVRSAILNDNEMALNRVKGIGPKTAKRILIDLKDKVFKLSGSDPILIGNNNNTMRDEALSALVALGFPKSSVEKQLDAIISNQSEINQVEDIIKAVLKQMR